VSSGGVVSRSEALTSAPFAFGGRVTLDASVDTPATLRTTLPLRGSRIEVSFDLRVVKLDSAVAAVLRLKAASELTLFIGRPAGNDLDLRYADLNTGTTYVTPPTPPQLGETFRLTFALDRTQQSIEVSVRNAANSFKRTVFGIGQADSLFIELGPRSSDPGAQVETRIDSVIVRH